MEADGSHDTSKHYRVIHRNVKYPRVEFKTGNLVVIVPANLRNHEDIVEKHRAWIQEKASIIASAIKAGQNTHLETRTKAELRQLVLEAISAASLELGVGFGRVFYRTMRSKWASCSPRGNLTVNTLMRFLPRGTIEYIIFHEAAHLIERRHNERFWDMISNRFDDADREEERLLVYWFQIHDRYLGNGASAYTQVGTPNRNADVAASEEGNKV